MVTRKSWKWIRAYEEARKKYSPEKSKEIANRTIVRRKPTPKRNPFGFRPPRF
jgi:hypothetical protein